MSDALLLVTGATGLAGSNACRIGVDMGYQVRALVRRREDAPPLEEIGAQIALGDITDPASLKDAMNGIDYVVHCAAIIGGTWTTYTHEQFISVNQDGAINVMSAANEAAVVRTVMLNTVGILKRGALHTEESPLTPISPTDSAYICAKRVAYFEGLARAGRGQDIVTVLPGGIYGPSMYLDRAIAPTSFNAPLIKGAKGELKRYLPMAMPWVFGEDVARVSLAALERGEIGRTYLAVCDPADAMSLPDYCNRFNALIGSPHRVENFDPFAEGADSDSEFGTMVEYAKAPSPKPLLDASWTIEQLGISPTRLDDGLARTAKWLKENGVLD